MAEPKTRPTDASVEEFLAAVPDARRRADAHAVRDLMHDVSGEAPVVWGTSIVGFGAREYADAKGKTMTWPLLAFAPRKTELVLYLNTDVEAALFDDLGPHRRGVGCLYVKRLGDVDGAALRRLVTRSLELARGAASPAT
jgi:hypothetical protein